jgi:hypothetical protein
VGIRWPFSADFRLIEGGGSHGFFSKFLAWLFCVQRTVHIFVLHFILREAFSLEMEKAAGKAQPRLLSDVYFRRQRLARATSDR